MQLYHTSDIEIRKPDIHHGRLNADFGQGFYLTPDKEFARRWAWKDAVINAYELDLSHLTVHRFTRDRDWADYIFLNRRAKDTLSADVVLGPIANDTIFDTLGIISSGYLDADEMLQLLLIGPAYTQVAVKTEKAAEALHWVGAERISAAKKDPKEQEAYQQRFAEALERIVSG